MHVSDIDPTYDQSANAKVVENLRNSESMIIQGLHRRKDGSTFPVEASLKLVHLDRDYVVSTVRDTSERKKAEEALLFKTALLEAQSETTIDGILAVDESEHIVLANKQFGIQFGVPAEMLDSKDDRIVFEHVVGQVESPEVFTEDVAYLYSHRDARSRDEFKLKGGKTFERYSAPLIDSNGRYWGRIWYFRDITERKQAEAELQESEARYRTLFETANDAILIADGERYSDCNLQAETLLGCGKDKIVGRTPLDFAPQRQHDGRLSAEVIVETLQAAMSGLSQTFEWAAARSDGTIFDTEVSLNRVIASGVEYVQIVVRDITKRKQTLESLKLFRLLVDQSNDTILVIDSETLRLIDVNARACSSLGYTREELLSMRVCDIDSAFDEPARAKTSESLRNS
jgi:two-component system sensor histidine kinase/response regulator